MTTSALPFRPLFVQPRNFPAVTGIICLQLNEFSVRSGRAHGNKPGKSGAVYAGATRAMNLKFGLRLDRSGPGHGGSH